MSRFFPILGRFGTVYGLSVAPHELLRPVRVVLVFVVSSEVFSLVPSIKICAISTPYPIEWLVNPVTIYPPKVGYSEMVASHSLSLSFLAIC